MPILVLCMCPIMLLVQNDAPGGRAHPYLHSVQV